MMEPEAEEKDAIKAYAIKLLNDVGASPRQISFPQSLSWCRLMRAVMPV
jgi:hypothetical protein